MVSLKKYYKKVKVSKIPSDPFGNRVRGILEGIITRLPDEEQFRIKGQIKFFPRYAAIEFWNYNAPKLGFAPDMSTPGVDGSCTHRLVENIEKSIFFITILVDNLENRSDGYIGGLIAHELSELSYAWKKIQENLPMLKKIKKPKARQIISDRITGLNTPIGSPEHAEHEANVNAEAIRLGFRDEILALENGNRIHELANIQTQP